MIHHILHTDCLISKIQVGIMQSSAYFHVSLDKSQGMPSSMSSDMNTEKMVGSITPL